MRKIRNAAVIIALCVVTGYQATRSVAPRLRLGSGDGLRDAVAGRRASPVDAGLRLSNTDDDSTHDRVSGNAVPGFNPGTRGNTIDEMPFQPPPRGTGNGGVGGFSGSNPGSQLPPSPPLSPFAPPQP
jgi:hypothetical protein